MKTRLFSFAFLFFISLTGKATTYFVATNGNDNLNNGKSVNTPFLTLSKAISVVLPKDTIFIREGIYRLNSTIIISTNGSQESVINLMSFPGDTQPVLDFSSEAFGLKGISLNANYWIIKGIKVKGAGDNGIYITGNNNKIEFCSFFDNRDSGLQLSGGASNNQIINCDSYYNADPEDYGDADGFAVKMDVGTGNYFYGCRAWLNCDDGWDGYLRGTNNVTTVIENCWSSWNGYFKDGTDAGANANGNGFKMGGSDDKTLKHNFILKKCLSFCNKSKCFDQNNNKGSMTLYNCTAFGGMKNLVINSELAEGENATIINCVSFNGIVQLGSFVKQQTNSWQPPFTINDEDFVSIDTSQTYFPRNADGSLPEITFMHLAEDSDLKDSGTDVGTTYVGIRPDIGFFEFGLIQNIDIIQDKVLTVYPTVTKNQLFIEPLEKGNLSSQIDIYNINGQKQNNYEVIPHCKLNMVELNVWNLPSGLYIFTTTLNGRYIQGKFIRQ